MVSSKHLLVMTVALIVAACQPVEVQQKKDESAFNPEAAALQEELFSAADNGDVRAFEMLLSKASIALFEQYFESMATLDRPKGEKAYGWVQMLKLFAQLPPAARKRTPFVVIQEDGKSKLDLAEHPDATFFTDVTQRLQATK